MIKLKELLREGFSSNMIKYAIGLADKYAGNMTKAVKLIDKIKKGLSDDPKVKAALQAANESTSKAITEYGNEPDIKKRWAVVLKGGSIGSGGGWSLNGMSIRYSFDDQGAAKRQAKRSNKRLSPGEKKYYGMRYLVRDIVKLKSRLRKEEIMNEAPDNDMFKALNKVNNDIFRIMNKYEGKADMDAVFRSWMLGIHSHLKKAGIKL